MNVFDAELDAWMRRRVGNVLVEINELLHRRIAVQAFGFTEADIRRVDVDRGVVHLANWRWVQTSTGRTGMFRFRPVADEPVLSVVFSETRTLDEQQQRHATYQDVLHGS